MGVFCRYAKFIGFHGDTFFKTVAMEILKPSCHGIFHQKLGKRTCQKPK